MSELHPIRKEILHNLLFTSESRFSDLKPTQMEGSQFTYHLDELVRLGYIKQNSNGSYSLTEEGKNFANKYDYDSKSPSIQAKHSVIVCPIRNNNEILVYKRLKNPFYGCQGFMTGKVQYGESIIETARREMKEETNLEGLPELLTIRHFRVFDKNTNKLLEDKVMYIHKVENPTGELIHNSEGEFFWLKLSEVNKTITNPLEEFQEVLEILLKPQEYPWFSEVIHKTLKY